MQQNIQANIAQQKGTDMAQVQGQFDYEANQVVLRDGRMAQGLESGEVSSLHGTVQFDKKKMGDRAQKAKPKKEEDKNQKEKEKQKQQTKKKVKKKESVLNAKKVKHIKIDKDINVTNVKINSDLIYKPKQKENKILYEQIITIISKLLVDLSTEELQSFTDEILAVLKADNKTDKEKFQEVKFMLKNLNQQIFDQLFGLSRQITDYFVDTKKQQETDVLYQEKEANLALSDSESYHGQEDEDENNQDQISSSEEEDNLDDEQEMMIEAKGDIEIEEEEDDQANYVGINEIDTYWLQNQLDEWIGDVIEAKALEPQVMKILISENDRICQSKLVEMLNYDKFDLVQKLTKNRFKIYFKTLLNQSQNVEDKKQIMLEMAQVKEGQEVLQLIETQGKGQTTQDFKKQAQQKQLKKQVLGLKQKELEADQEKINKLLMTQDIKDAEFNKISRKYLDLENLQFENGSHTMSNQKTTLPPDSFRISKKGYEEIYIPAVKHKPQNQTKIAKENMPAWTHMAFNSADFKSLNFVQSQVYNTALFTNENMLVCAPTGAGKTNVALLTMLQEIGKWRKNGRIDLQKFKIVYISPMKALVAEQVGNFQNRLKDYGIKVRELTGDMQLSKQQIEDTQVIISTPEKWDIVTRKSGDRTYTELVKLLIIDEIHLLHDQRGPVLESLAARTIRQIEQTQSMVRIVGLSATLPNYTDVASFIRVKKQGLFYFDHTYRPVPLEQQYIGVTEKKAVRRVMLMNEILYDKVIERAGKYPMIIFVHSRRDTLKTAEYLKEIAYGRDELQKFVKDESDSKKILTHVSESTNNPDLKELLPYGLAIHHAGLSRGDREDVEHLFAGRHIQVLVSTATLAWGVNLPAHTVIIKGTQVYSPEEGKWKELSPQDVLQMMGRAGRPGYDTKGEGIILTTYSEMKFYLSLLNQQLPIESQFITNLPDQLNAEIVLGTVTNLKEAVNWLGYTYLYIRMLRNTKLYGISDDEIEEDRLLVKRRTHLIHSAATLLDKNQLIKYDKKIGTFQVTSLGKIASHYYIKFPSIETYNKHLKPNMSMIELFRIFALSCEFKFIPIRDEEKGEILKLMDTVPIPIKGSADDPPTKINILLQAYIAKLSLEGFALNADMVYVTQSAGRIMRAIFEICLRRGWGQAAEVSLNVCKMIDKRMWSCMTVLRQFKGIPEEILKRIEKKEQFTFDHFYNMTANQIGELIKLPKLGKILHKYIHQFPKLDLKPYLQPITRSCLKIDLTITPDFQWDSKIHGNSEPFYIIVEDCNGEEILYTEYFTLQEKHIMEGRDYTFSFTVPLFENLHPLYYIKVISDRWLQSETVMPVSFKNLILPERFAAPTELYDLQLLPVSSMDFKQGQEVMKKLKVKQFNQIQTQVYQSFYDNTTDNIFLGAPTGSGKSICMYLTILKTFQQYPDKKIVYVSPKEELCSLFYEEMKLLFQKTFHKKIAILQGQLQSDLKIMESHDIILTSADNLDILTKRWKTRKVLKEIKLMIFDELHLLGDNYSIYEIVVSRMRLVQSTLAQQTKLQLIGLSTSVADFKEMSSWFGASQNHTYNFHPNVRPYPIEIIVYPFDQNDRKQRILSMQKYMYQGIKRFAEEKQTIVFVSDRKQARLTAIDLTTMAAADNTPQRFLRGKQDALQKELQDIELGDPIFLNVLESGIGLLYEGQNENEKQFVKLLYKLQIIQVLVVTHQISWELSEHAFFTVILDNQRYDGYEKKFTDYTIPDMLQMIGRSQNKQGEESAKSLVLCQCPKKDYYKKFLLEPYPVESHLNHYLHNHLCGEIVSKNIASKHDCIDWITWTFMYWRLTQNPNYYNLLEVSGSTITDYLSELIEVTVEELEESKCIAVEEEIELLPLNLGIIASYYYIHTSSIEMFAENIKDDSKMKHLIQILCNATEYEETQIRQAEELTLRDIANSLEHYTDSDDFQEPSAKTNVLLQSHFSRLDLNPDLRYDQKQILEKSVRLVHAMVDVISSNCWLNQAIMSMQMNQMVVQSLWANKSTLYQLPYLDAEIVSKLQQAEVNDIDDFMNMEDDDRSKILSHLSEDQVTEIAEAANRYPNISMNYKIKNDLSSITQGDIVDIQVNIERNGDEDDYTDYVIAPYFPKQKEELWWVLCGDKEKNKLYAIKRVSFKLAQKVNLKFEINENGQQNLVLYLICDSYIGCDDMEKFSINVLENDDDEEDDDDDDDE